MTLIARLGTRIGSVGRQGAVSATINAAASTLDLISFAIVARILSPETLGIFLIALAVGTIVERVGSPNFSQTFIRHAVRAIEKQRAADLRHILELALLFDFGLLAFGSAAGFVTAALVVPSGHQATFVAVVLTVMFAALRPPLLAVAMPRAFGRHETVMAWLLLGALVKVVVLGMVMVEGGGILGVAIAFAAWRLIAATGGLVTTALEAHRHGALSTKRSGQLSFAEQHEDFWAFTRAGAVTVLPQAAVDFSTLLIGILSGVATAGLYRLATKVGEASRIYTNPISFILYADQCTAVERGELRRLWTQTIRWCLTVGIVTALGAGLFVAEGNFLVEKVFGKGYYAAVPAITWCVVAAVPYSMAVLLQFALFAVGAVNQVLRAESIAAILFLAIVVALQTPSAEQAAIALAISRFVSLAASAVLFVIVVRRPARHAMR
jgi:O-antigen/teichoic acid export membrane protein